MDVRAIFVNAVAHFVKYPLWLFGKDEGETLEDVSI